MFALREGCRGQYPLLLVLLLLWLTPSTGFSQSSALSTKGVSETATSVEKHSARAGGVGNVQNATGAGTESTEPELSTAPVVATDEASAQALRLDELAEIVQRKKEQREEIKQLLAGNEQEALVKERETLVNLNRDIARLSTTFESIALGNIDTSILSDQENVETDWRKDLLEILNPLIESLKSVTKRPRELAELRNSLSLSDSRVRIAQKALASLEAIKTDSLDTDAVAQVARLVSKWQDDEAQFKQERMIAQNQLDRLTEDQQTFFEGVWPATRLFILGRGLTLLMAVAAALLTWALMRFLWWVYTTRFTSKEQRRNSTWYRLLAYSYYLLTSLIMVLVVLVVLYIREDLLLLALGLLVIAGAALSFRQFLPRYIREARLLLNLGAVREDERVMYNGLPWQVASLNLYSVLRNPALDGVIRLPLGIVSTLVSRPVKNKLWFPTNRGDYVILPDGAFGQIKVQTPDLVEISVRGGMTMTYTTADFYAINLINLSRDEHFGISVTFGFDYALQQISLTDVPQKLELALRTALIERGYEKQIVSMVVELSAANSSSLDFLLFVTLSSKVASDYFKLQRLVQQTCVAVSNANGWTIPFPQLTIHKAN